MKLDSINVLRGIFQALMREPAPLNEIDGVKCVVDFLGATIKIGEDREQTWFEVTLHDVTPRRFLSREEQTELLYGGEDPEWWSVTGPTRMAFVRALSRSKAMQYFAAKYHETATDCELARGFEFVDPTKEELPEELPPAPGFSPVGPTVPGCCPHASSNEDNDDGDEPSSQEEEEPRGMKIVVDFQVTDADDEMRLEHPDEFEFDVENQTALDAIQSVVDEWESKGVTIDQGGDKGHYELSLEGCEALELDATLVQAKQILQDVARALRDAGIPSAPTMPDDPAPLPEDKPQEEAEKGPEKTEYAGDDGVEPEFRNLKPQDYYFGVGGGGGGLMDEEAWLVICPKSFWDANGHMYDGYLGDVWKMFPEYLQSPEDMECTWMLPDGKMTEDVAIDMAVLGFDRNLILEGLCESIHES